MATQKKANSRQKPKPAPVPTDEQVADIVTDRVIRWIMREFSAARDFEKGGVVVDWEALRMRTDALLSQTATITSIVRGESG